MLCPVSLTFELIASCVLSDHMNVRQLAPWTICPRQLAPNLQTR